MNKNSTQVEKYDLLVLGSGAAGKLTSWSLAKQGMKTGVIEREYIGGSCPNIACLPSKNIIHSAKVASYFWRSAEFGISKNNCRIDMAGVRERKRKMVHDLVEMHLANYKASGAELIMGTGRFIGPKIIEVTLNAGGKRVLRGEHVLIDTGTRAAIDNTPGLRKQILLRISKPSNWIVFQAAMLAELPYTSLRDAIFTHPTMSEGLIFLFEAVPSKRVAKAAVREKAFAHG